MKPSTGGADEYRDRLEPLLDRLANALHCVVIQCEVVHATLAPASLDRHSHHLLDAAHRAVRALTELRAFLNSTSETR